MKKVNLDVIKPWISKRITEMLGFEDDVVIDFCFNMLEKTQVICQGLVQGWEGSIGFLTPSRSLHLHPTNLGHYYSFNDYKLYQQY